jgi:hypothetical protein
MDFSKYQENHKRLLDVFYDHINTNCKVHDVNLSVDHMFQFSGSNWTVTLFAFLIVMYTEYPLKLKELMELKITHGWYYDPFEKTLKYDENMVCCFRMVQTHFIKQESLFPK